ncbi:PREDICTED: uncharacterized protein LOC104410269, partial [Nestor notabilis]|uniref:uncharacterized protein LOC104410269 n=1 Tax=Nestor notabilis TaxID=176057 RepID=UPI000523CC8F
MELQRGTSAAQPQPSKMDPSALPELAIKSKENTSQNIYPEDLHYYLSLQIHDVKAGRGEKEVSYIPKTLLSMLLLSSGPYLNLGSPNKQENLGGEMQNHKLLQASAAVARAWLTPLRVPHHAFETWWLLVLGLHAAKTTQEVMSVNGTSFRSGRFYYNEFSSRQAAVQDSYLKSSPIINPKTPHADLKHLCLLEEDNSIVSSQMSDFST